MLEPNQVQNIAAQVAQAYYHGKSVSGKDYLEFFNEVYHNLSEGIRPDYGDSSWTYDHVRVEVKYFSRFADAVPTALVQVKTIMFEQEYPLKSGQYEGPPVEPNYV